MARTNRSILVMLAFTFAMVMGLPLTSAAQQPNQGTWLASATAADAQEATWGRMTLKDGVLVFSAANLNWQSPIADIKRVTERKGPARQFTIETASGDVLHVSILGLQMLPESPRKVMQTIERAVRSTPATRGTVAAVAAGGGSSF